MDGTCLVGEVSSVTVGGGSRLSVSFRYKGTGFSEVTVHDLLFPAEGTVTNYRVSSDFNKFDRSKFGRVDEVDGPGKEGYFCVISATWDKRGGKKTEEFLGP